MSIGLTSTSTTGKLTVNAVDVLTVDASNNLSLRSGGALVPIDDLRSIGIGQTWRDVTATRSANTTFTALPNRPRFVSISLTHNSVISRLTVNGIVVSSNGGDAVGEGLCVSALVPPGGTYSLNLGNTITTWAELDL